MIKVAIVEDSKQDLNDLLSCLTQYEKEHSEEFQIDSFSNGLDFIEKYNEGYDLVFMDVNMPYENGISISKRLRLIDKDVPIVFVTQMAQYAISAFDVSAKDYLLKPIIYSSFAFRFSKILDGIKINSGNDGVSFLVKTSDAHIKINSNDITYVEVVRHTLIFHTLDGEFETGGSLKNIEAKLSGQGKTFAKCNNCYLINLRYIEKIESETLYLKGAALKISRSRKKEFMDRVCLYYAEGGH